MEDLIIKWAKERGVINKDPAQPMKHLLKAIEELGELAKAELEGNKPKIADGIGDVLIVLIIYAYQKNLSADYCLHFAYEQIKDRKGETKNGTFIKN